MSQYASPAPVTISAGTCFKIGFFGALGAFVFGLIVSIVLGVISLVLAAIVGVSLLESLN